MKLRPINKVIVNGYTIDRKTTWEDIEKIEPKFGKLSKAFDLYMNAAYPRYFKSELENYEGKHDVVIYPSNHKKYKKERLENPEWWK